METGTILEILPAEDDDGETVKTSLGTFSVVIFEFVPQVGDTFTLSGKVMLTATKTV